MTGLNIKPQDEVAYNSSNTVVVLQLRNALLQQRSSILFLAQIVIIM